MSWLIKNSVGKRGFRGDSVGKRIFRDSVGKRYCISKNGVSNSENEDARKKAKHHLHHAHDRHAPVERIATRKRKSKDGYEGAFEQRSRIDTNIQNEVFGSDCQRAVTQGMQTCTERHSYASIDYRWMVINVKRGEDERKGGASCARTVYLIGGKRTNVSQRQKHKSEIGPRIGQNINQYQYVPTAPNEMGRCG
jgi:hypothetical protein